jgi:hypothetical protein
MCANAVNADTTLRISKPSTLTDLGLRNLSPLKSIVCSSAPELSAAIAPDADKDLHLRQQRNFLALANFSRRFLFIHKIRYIEDKNHKLDPSPFSLCNTALEKVRDVTKS